jgi:hypothetical protein
MNTKALKTLKIAALVFLCAAQPLSVLAQSGYVSINISAGDNLIANQLDDGNGNTLNDVFANGGVITGSTFTEFNSSLNALMPLSTFNGTTWSINYPLGPNGIGGVLNSPSTTTLVTSGTIENYNASTMQYTFVPPTRGMGTYLLSLAAPLNEATFQEIVGRDPMAGDFVQILNPATQTYVTTTYNGTTWDNGTPILGQDQSAYFNLGVIRAPEPASLALMALGAASFYAFRRRC